ncbi:MAG: DUF1501 domain-containing protein [Armatimonadota bacterium]
MRAEAVGHRHTIGITRRELLQAGYSGLLGLSLAGARAASAAPAPRGRARAVILVFLTGGPSHLDMFDPKPDSPAEVRGEFGTIPTALPGVRFAEHLPGFAKRLDRLAVVRSMTHKNNGHLPATHWLLTGKAIPGIPEHLGVDKIRSRSDWPSYGSALGYFRPRTDGVPSGVHLPTYLQEPPLLWPGQYAGCMGPKYDPWQITDDPNKESFRVDHLSLPAGFGVERLQARRSILETVNRQQDRLGRLAEMQALDDQQRSAFTLLTSSAFAEAFRLEKEPAALRDQYGRHMFGQSLLLARRLVEAGVPIVQANMGIVQTWDTHADNWGALKNRLLPPLDRGVGALLDDLRDRGLAEETLVIVVGEFGRTPKISTLAGQTIPGRDHWCDAFTAVFSGAGVRGGQVIGATDAQGGSPATHAFTPDDLGATVYQALGIDPAAEFLDREGRPQRLNTGQVMEPLYTGRTV